MWNIETLPSFLPKAERLHLRFDLVDLRLFVFIAEGGSITHGADRAGLALASASARIRGMEERLGVPLLERRRRGIALTPAGHALLHHAQTLQSQIEEMTGELAGYAKGLRARVRLLSNTAAAVEILPEIIADFLAAHPTIDVELDERPSHAIVEAIAAGSADLGIAIARDDLNLAQRPFRLDRLVVAASRSWRPAQRGRSVSYEEVATEPFVGLDPGNALQDYVLRHASRLGFRTMFRVRLTTLDALAPLVERGTGLAVMPETTPRRLVRTHRLRVLALRDRWATRELVLWARDFSALPPHARRLADAIAPTGSVATSR